MGIFIQFLYKFKSVIAIIVLIGLCVFIRSFYLSKYEKEVKAFETYKTEQLEKQNKELKVIVKTQEDLQKSYVEQMENLRNDFNKIDNIRDSNKQQLNGLYKVLSDNKTTAVKSDASTVIAYTNTLSDLLGTCSGTITEFAEAADKATASTLMYYNFAKEQKEIVDKHNRDIQDIK